MSKCSLFEVTKENLPLFPFFSVFDVGHSAYFGDRSFWKLSLLKPLSTSSEFEFLLCGSSQH